MDLVCDIPIESHDYLAGLHPYSYEELSQMGVELGYLDEEDFLEVNKGKSPMSKWFLLSMLITYVVIIISFGSAYVSEGKNKERTVLPDFNHTAFIYDGYQLYK